MSRLSLWRLLDKVIPMSKPNLSGEVTLDSEEVRKAAEKEWQKFDKDFGAALSKQAALVPHYEAVEAVDTLLRYLGEDPKRNGLLKTPERVVKALVEMTAGYQENPAEILGTVFEESYDEVVILKDIPFTSLCEHHLLGYSGTCDIGYIPSEKKVVGLSKLARLVDCFSRRLTIQEKLTRQIADTIEQHLGAKGVAVVVRGIHSCMCSRGVRKPGSTMITSCMLGAFRDNPSARSEFLELCKK